MDLQCCFDFSQYPVIYYDGIAHCVRCNYCQRQLADCGGKPVSREYLERKQKLDEMMEVADELELNEGDLTLIRVLREPKQLTTTQLFAYKILREKCIRKIYEKAVEHGNGEN